MDRARQLVPSPSIVKTNQSGAWSLSSALEWTSPMVFLW